jgi:phage/plasmid-like protein (TIGR03299 family)
MSYHTMQYLNAGNILVGNGQKAWWYDQRLEDVNNPTHFSGMIPVSVVKEKLFGWSALESVKMLATFEVNERDDDGNIKLGDDGNALTREIVVPVKSFKAIGREDWITNGVPDTEEEGADAILSVQGESYGVHQLQTIFINTMAEIVGGADSLGIESAGLLKWGRRAWMTISVPKNIHNDASGLDFRPQLTASTSFDGSLATSFTRTYGVPVCDNTLDYQLMRAGEKGKFVLRHTKNSVARIKDAREALGLLEEQADEMDAALTEMIGVEVNDAHFEKWLNVMVPVPELKESTRTIKSIQGEDVEVKKINTNGQSIAINKRDRLITMWSSDPRVIGPDGKWRNTKLGLLQLWNTYQTHEATIKGAKSLGGNKVQARVEGNMMRVLGGKFAEEDAKAFAALDSVFEEMAVPVIQVPVGAPSGGTATATKRRPSRAKAADADNN